MKVALLRERVDPRTFKIRQSLADLGLIATEFVRTDPYVAMFGTYASTLRTEKYRFYYDGWGYEFIMHHLELANAASYSTLSKRLSQGGYDVVHSNSVTDYLAAGMRRWGRIPVIAEVYDTTSLYEINNIRVHFTRAGRSMSGLRKWAYDHVASNALRWEKEIHERGAGLVYTSKAMLDYARKKYPVSVPSIVVPNAVYGKALPRSPAPQKLSQTEGGIHLVYSGVIRNSETGHHRDICGQLNRVSRGDVVTHLYPIIPESERQSVHALLDGNKNIRWHEPVDYETLYDQLRRYDAGLVILAPYDLPLLRVALPNKIFEYAAAGIPSLVSPYPPLVEFVREFDCGQPIMEPESVQNEFRQRKVAMRSEFTIEHYIPSLVKLYELAAQSA